MFFATADFMASFARYDSAKHKYVLGKGVIAAQERFKAEETSLTNIRIGVLALGFKNGAAMAQTFRPAGR